MPNEPKADWDVKSAALRLLFELDAALLKNPTDRIVEDIAESHLRSAHASGAREAEEKLLREARTVAHYANNVLLYWDEGAHDSGDGNGCAVCGNDPDEHEQDEPCGELQRALVDFEKAYGRTTPALSDLVAGGLGDASRVGGKETT